MTQSRHDPKARAAPDILVVEDNDSNRVLALRQLEKLGYRATAVRNGREAVDAAAGSEYRLILMDCQMPEMDGFQATREIRKREVGAEGRTPIVAMTASATAPDREACLAAGMDDFITKPVMIDALREAVVRWMHGSARAEPALAPPARPTVVSPSGPIDPGTLHGLRSELGEDAFSRFADAYLSELGARADAILGAVEENVPEALTRTAHTLKSSSAALGAVALADLCRELEALGRTGTVTGGLEKAALVKAECTGVRAVLEEEREAPPP